MVSSYKDLIQFYGGVKGVADRFGIGAPAVSNWNERGIPTGLHLRILLDVKAEGGDVDPNLFHMTGEYARRMESLVFLKD